jgi:hypothetical protein
VTINRHILWFNFSLKIFINYIFNTYMAVDLAPPLRKVILAPSFLMNRREGFGCASGAVENFVF